MQLLNIKDVNGHELQQLCAIEDRSNHLNCAYGPHAKPKRREALWWKSHPVGNHCVHKQKYPHFIYTNISVMSIHSCGSLALQQASDDSLWLEAEPLLLFGHFQRGGVCLFFHRDFRHFKNDTVMFWHVGGPPTATKSRSKTQIPSWVCVKKLCWASRDAALKQCFTLLVANGPSFSNNMFPGLRACEVLLLHVFEVRSCFLTSCHRPTSAASRLLSHMRRLLLLLPACSTLENVCVSWMTASLHPYSHRARWGQPSASVLQLPLYLFNKCD